MIWEHYLILINYTLFIADENYIRKYRGGQDHTFWNTSVIIPIGWVGGLTKNELVPMSTKSCFFALFGVGGKDENTEVYDLTVPKCVVLTPPCYVNNRRSKLFLLIF